MAAEAGERSDRQAQTFSGKGVWTVDDSDHADKVQQAIHAHVVKAGRPERDATVGERSDEQAQAAVSLYC